ncbi:MAG: hypothetical protein MJ066_05990, partial [Clostridia bacterium]|nr:hypothetical protein [Clostridia bacterium]
SPNVNKKDFIEEVREYKLARIEHNEKYVDETQMKFYCEQIESGSVSVDTIKRKIGSYNFTKYERYINEARQRYIRNVAPMPFPRSNFYIEAEKDTDTNSKSGMGKSVFAKCLACVLAKEFGADENMSFEDLVKNKYVYVLGDTKVKLQNYDGEPILFIDDLSNKDLKDMFGHKIIKNLFDEFPVRFDIDRKYGYCCVISKYIIINGIEDFDVFANGLMGRYKDKNGEEVNADKDTTQMFRRFIAHFKVVNENNIDIYWNKGILQRTREYKEYERDRIYFNVAESLLLRKISQLPFADRIKVKLLDYQKKVKNRTLTDNEVREIIMKATKSQEALEKFNALSKTYDEKNREIVKLEDKEYSEYLVLKEKQKKLPLNKTEYERFLELDKKFNVNEDLPF